MKTSSHDNHSDLTIASNTGQHSQFLQMSLNRRPHLASRYSKKCLAATSAFRVSRLSGHTMPTVGVSIERGWGISLFATLGSKLCDLGAFVDTRTQISHYHSDKKNTIC